MAYRVEVISITLRGSTAADRQALADTIERQAKHLGALRKITVDVTKNTEEIAR